MKLYFFVNKTIAHCPSVHEGLEEQQQEFLGVVVLADKKNPKQIIQLILNTPKDLKAATNQHNYW